MNIKLVFEHAMSPAIVNPISMRGSRVRHLLAGSGCSDQRRNASMETKLFIPRCSEVISNGKLSP
jgi:hypothetical protein